MCKILCFKSEGIRNRDFYPVNRRAAETRICPRIYKLILIYL